MIKAVLFDLDETLLVRKAAIRAFIEDQYKRHVAILDSVGADRYVTRFLAVEDEGRNPKVLAYPQVAAELGLTPAVAADLLADYQAIYPSYAVLSAGARETLVALRAKGLKIGIITNGNALVQNSKIDATGLRPLLDIVLVSEAEGLRKPDPAIFELALQRLGITAAEAIFVGDNPAADVDGARNAGLLAVWYHSTTDWPADLAPPAHTITSLSEVVALCGEVA
ncbi:putative hydrolase of the HAD superfamily [Devosia sp. UYZn731]|uniref:HAD family hydrolase n=1 Tax=Devosia sp. UYZn731 TaxID=3156345 RepID=UPI003396EE0F